MPNAAASAPAPSTRAAAAPADTGSTPDAIGRCAFNGCRRSLPRSTTSFTSVTAPDRFLLRFEGLEHGQQLGDRQEIRDAFRQVQQLEAAALPAYRRVGAHHFTETRAVDVRHISEIQDDLLLALVDEAVDLVLEQL